MYSRIGNNVSYHYCCCTCRSRQLREVLRMASIESNSHVVELETAWEEDGHLFFQMELCLKSLSQDIEEGHLFSESEVTLRGLIKYNLKYILFIPYDLYDDILARVPIILDGQK